MTGRAYVIHRPGRTPGIVDDTGHAAAGFGSISSTVESDIGVRRMAAIEPQSPAARRLRAPSWLDVRLVIGVLMVLVAILVGARVVASSDKSIKVWAVAHDVAPGTRLTDDDLRPERVRLFGDSARYLSVQTSPLGRTVNRDLRAGDLLPGAALVAAPATAVLPLSVDLDDTPPGLAHGDRIDVYVIPGASDRSGPTQLVLGNAVVQSVSGGSDGLASENSKVQITVTLDPRQEDGVVKHIAAGTLYVVQRIGQGSTGTGPGHDTAAPGPSATAPADSPSANASPTATPSR